jgi:hypothetical protein
MHSIGFLKFACNDVYHSTQDVSLLSSVLIAPSDLKKGGYKGPGVFIYSYNIRDPLALFGARSLVKSHWVNSNDVFIGRED